LPQLDDLDTPLTPIPGDIPSPLERPSGCVFNTRCSANLGARCSSAIPEFLKVTDDHQVACHLYDEGASK